MANQVDRTGTFRFSAVLETGISETKNGFPSFNVRLKLSEYYDESEETWVDWNDYDTEAIAYFTLFGKNKKTNKVEPCLNHTQIMKVFNWDGRSFQTLANDDYSSIRGQVRIGENTYEGARNPFQVEWIDVFDADPVRQLRKLDADGLKNLDQKFAQVLQSTGKTPAPATAKKTSKPSVPKTGTPKPEPPMTNEDKQAALKAKSEKIKAAAKKPSTPPPAKKQEDERTMTKQKAWESIIELKDDDIADEQLADIWHSTIDETGDEDKFTSDQWTEVLHKVLDTEYEDGKTVGKI